jgi:hypothetical protein
MADRTGAIAGISGKRPPNRACGGEKLGGEKLGDPGNAKRGAVGAVNRRLMPTTSALVMPAIAEGTWDKLWIKSASLV